MPFLTVDDLEKYMTPEEIDQITDGDTTILDAVIADAEEFSAEKLRQRYNMVNEYAKTGTDRNRSLLKQVVAVALYFLSERIPTDILPESREMAFEKAENWLDEVARGKRDVLLEEKDADSQTGWPIRWGSKNVNTGSNHY